MQFMCVRGTACVCGGRNVFLVLTALYINVCIVLCVCVCVSPHVLFPQLVRLHVGVHMCAAESMIFFFPVFVNQALT